VARPDYKAVYPELILPVFTQWAKVGSITQILADLEQGNFHNAALLADQMMRDDRINAVLSVRVNAVLSQPWAFAPGKDTATGRRACEEAEASWWEMVPRAELALLLRWGLLLGVGLARLSWRRDAGEWVPSLKVYHPGALWYNLAKDQYHLNYQGGVEPIDPDDPNWIVFTPYGYKYGRTNGLLRALAMPYLARQWAFRDRARHSERHGQPFLQGVAPAQADDDEKKSFKRALAALGSETVVVTPQGEPGNQWDIELIEAKSNSHEVFSAQIDHLDKAIAILVLGQSMSTEGVSGLGSQEKAGDLVRRDLMRSDAAHLSDIARAVLSPWALYTYGSRDLAPTVSVTVDPPINALQRAQALAQLASSMAALEGLGVDPVALLAEQDVPMVDADKLAALSELRWRDVLRAHEQSETPSEEAAESPTVQQVEAEAGVEAAPEAEGTGEPDEAPEEEKAEEEPVQKKLDAAALSLVAASLKTLREAGAVVDLEQLRALFPTLPVASIYED